MFLKAGFLSVYLRCTNVEFISFSNNLLENKELKNWSHLSWEVSGQEANWNHSSSKPDPTTTKTTSVSQQVPELVLLVSLLLYLSRCQNWYFWSLILYLSRYQSWYFWSLSFCISAGARAGTSGLSSSVSQQVPELVLLVSLLLHPSRCQSWYFWSLSFCIPAGARAGARPCSTAVSILH